MRSSRQGFSLLELTVVILISGLIVAGIWVTVGQINHENKKTALGRDVIQIILNARALFADQSASITAFSSRDAITAGIFPPSWTLGNRANPVLRQPFATDPTQNSANMALAPTAGNEPARLMLTVGIAGSTSLGLPPDACVSLVTKLATLDNFDRLGFERIEISNGSGLSTFRANVMPLTVAQIATACTTTTGDQVGVFFDPT